MLVYGNAHIAILFSRHLITEHKFSAVIKSYVFSYP